MADAATPETIAQPVEHSPDHQAILSSEVFFDRANIEAQAWHLIDTRHHQPEVEVPRQEYKDNARTALMEALTASGHLSRVEITGSLEQINQQVLNRLLNGWNDQLPQHEKDRRFQEVCEELLIQRTHQAIIEGVLPPNTAVGVISDCPVVEMPGLGYRYENRKGMVRSTHLEYNADGTFTRVIEQVSRSNSGWASTFGFLSSCEIYVDSGKTPDVAGLQAPFLYTTADYPGAVVDIQRQLDRWSVGDVLYGDSGDKAHRHVGYESLREESARREGEIKGYIDDLAALEAQLDGLKKGNKLSETEALDIYKGEVMRILDAICSLDPDYAEATFGQAAAVVFYEANQLLMRGQTQAAADLLEANQFLKKTVTFCGMSISLEKAKELGLEVNDYEELVEKGKESWQWKQGVCQVKSCPTRPTKTKVGPCSVCERCQRKFDAGQDPTKDKPSQ